MLLTTVDRSKSTKGVSILICKEAMSKIFFEDILIRLNFPECRQFWNQIITVKKRVITG